MAVVHVLPEQPHHDYLEQEVTGGNIKQTEQE